MNKNKESCQQNGELHEPEDEEELYLLFDEMVQPDLCPNEQARCLYEKMKERFGFEQKDD